MATAAFAGVMWHMRAKADCATRTDDELLDRFRNERDEAAFAAIVRRHGPMVFGVCRRTLRNDADAEDAFQATFLVLARKAHEVRPSGRVGHWLYGVAYNTSRKARVMNRRRTNRELRAGELRPHSVSNADPSDLYQFLDVELSRLPEQYRSAVVTCDLEGESLKQAAERLDCPVGTVASRLARGRELLRRNLQRRGIALSALLVPGIASARVPARLALSTTQTVAGVVPATTPVLALTQGVIQAMFLSKIKFAFAAIVAAGVLVAGIGNGTSFVQADPDKPVKPGADPVKPVKPVADPVKPVGDPVKPAKPGADPVKPGEKPAKPEKPVNPDVKKGAGFVGTLKSIDAEKGTITVTATKGDTSVDRTFPIAKDAKVSIDGKEGKLADLKAGIRVGVKLGDDKTTAVAIGSEA
jgi:RNA polymerase sigma factor (sigma-70 family)